MGDDDDDEDVDEAGDACRTATKASGNGGGDVGGPRRLAPGARPRIKPPIQDIFRRGDEVLVQVIKEGIGTKGPTLSTYISIPGRYLGADAGAAAAWACRRKIEDDETRRQAARRSCASSNRPKGLGFIVRTAGIDRTQP